MLGVISAVLLTSATVITGVGLLAQFWNEITNWLKNIVNAIKNIAGKIYCGFKAFVKKIKGALQEISKHYHKNGTQWEVTTHTRTIPESEVPEEIRAKANSYNETDITEELKMQLVG